VVCTWLLLPGLLRVAVPCSSVYVCMEMGSFCWLCLWSGILHACAFCLTNLAHTSVN
jgi:hypothetical protein